jgi:NitT/TauT family transport system substrate-binding protein
MWQRRGLEVKVDVYKGGIETMNALANGDADICYDEIASWVSKSISAKIPLKILGDCVWSSGAVKVLVKRGVDIKDLKGEPIGIYTDNFGVRVFLGKFLARSRLKLSNFDLVLVRDEDLLADGFISGRFKVIVHYDPSALRAEQEGEGEVGDSDANYPGCIPEGFAARADVLIKIPAEDLVKFFQGWMDAVEWCRAPANRAEWKRLVLDKIYSEPPLSDHALNRMIESVTLLNPAELASCNRPKGKLEIFLQEGRALLLSDQSSDESFPFIEMVTTQAIIEAAEGYSPPQ